MKKWLGLIIFSLLLIASIVTYGSFDVFGETAQTKVKVDIDTVKIGFDNAINDGSRPDDTNGWVTSMDIAKWRLLDKQILKTLPIHPATPNEKYHYKIWTDTIGKKQIAIWARYKQGDALIYCNNRATLEMIDAGYSNDQKANEACEKQKINSKK